MIGTAYHLGIGVEANRLRAARWLMASAAQGSPLAQAYLPRVEAELTADEKLVLKEEESSGHCMNVNGIELCGSYAGFERGIIRNYEADTPGLGYSAAYHEPEKGHATIYIYDKQLTGIPDGPDSPQAHQEFRRAIDEVATAPAGREIELIDTYGTESPERGKEFLCAEFRQVDATVHGGVPFSISRPPGIGSSNCGSHFTPTMQRTQPPAILRTQWRRACEARKPAE